MIENIFNHMFHILNKRWHLLTIVKKNYSDSSLCLPFETEISDKPCFFKALLTRSVKAPISGRQDVLITANVINSVSLVTRMSFWGSPMRGFCLSANSSFMFAERASLHRATSSLIKAHLSLYFNSHSVNQKCLKWYHHYCIYCEYIYLYHMWIKRFATYIYNSQKMPFVIFC